MKNLSRIFFGATALCSIAVCARAGQLQPVTADEDPERITAETPSYDPAPDSMNLGPHDTSGVPPLKRPAGHPVYPELDHPDSSHEVPSSLPDGAIDACSLRCLSCHDGICAPETRIKTVGEWGMSFDTHRYFHPLGANYDSAAAGNAALTPSVLLPSEITLPDGKVGCESCHNLHSSNAHFLIITIEGGALCLECHIK